MFRNNFQPWTPIFSCSLLSSGVIIISISVILSLIPLYVNNNSVAKSNTTYTVYTVDNVIFIITTSITTRTKRQVDSSSVIPAGNMIASINDEINNFFRSIGANVIVTKALMASRTRLNVTLKIYFPQGCFACELYQRNLIKQLLRAGRTISIYTEFYTNCTLDPIAIGRTVFTLVNAAENAYVISRTIGTSITSLIRQPDLCGNRAALVFPTDCIRTEATGTVVGVVAVDEPYKYYCYYFVTSASATNINLMFVFSSLPGPSHSILDDVTLNSTTNLISNGGFEDHSLSGSVDNWPPWTFVCSVGCITSQIDPLGEAISNSFVSTGANVQLSQTVAITTVGRQYVHRLGFWFKCSTPDPDQPCSFFVTLTTT